MNLTDAQRAKLAQRLTLRHDRSDRGSLLPLTAAALANPTQTLGERADRAVELQSALVTERLIVPVPVEVHPDDSGEHRSQGLGEDDDIPLPVVEGKYGPMVLAFSSAEQLAAWDPTARPMTMSSQRVAVAATQAGAPPAIQIDAGSTSTVILPVAAVHALVGGDRWPAPWYDVSLAEELLQAARTQCSGIVAVRVHPAGSEGDESGVIWNGMLDVVVLFEIDPTSDMAVQKLKLANALGLIAKHPRLSSAAPAVRLTPRPVALA
ncbi:SseB family protein [Actinomyces minihominis]|uniref:SseB family protein n=1 Tax=Actinomyces minihominis TaxID=2002838 RepID=UPI000C06A492|nr:SseB family protein [Actinomyces minihominis]